jgi:hypothetical protein
MNASSNFRLAFAQRFSPEFKSSDGVSDDPQRNATSLKWSNRGRNDMSTFTFTVTLLLLATTGAAQTDNPMFWLLIGPAPFAVVFAGLVFFRHGLVQNVRRNRCVRGCLKSLLIAHTTLMKSFIMAAPSLSFARGCMSITRAQTCWRSATASCTADNTSPNRNLRTGPGGHEGFDGAGGVGPIGPAHQPHCIAVIRAVQDARAVMFLASVGFWNFLGAGIFGFLINLPIVSYYEIGTALTANHAHASISLWSLNLGLAWMVFATLFPLGVGGVLPILYLCWLSIRYMVPGAKSTEEEREILFTEVVERIGHD